MAEFRILWDNLWDGGEVDAETEQADFPATNTQHIWRKRVWRSDEESGGIDTWIRCEVGESGQEVTAVVIENHNFTPDTVVTITGSNNPDGIPAGVVVTPDVTETRIAHFFAAPESWDYWIISIVDPALTYAEIGRVFLGTYFEFDHHYRKVSRHTLDPSGRVQSDGGQVASNQQDRYKAFDFGWSPGAVSDEEVEDLYEVFEMVGGAVPYWICHDTELPLPDAVYYVLNTRDWSFDPVTWSRWGFALTVEEAR